MAAQVTDLTEANGWIPEPKSSAVLTKVYQESAVESTARIVRMTAPTMSVPRFESDGVDIVAEHATIPLQDATLDEVTLRAVKFANRFAISIEDQRDALVDVLDQKKLAWANSFARKLDNACLGVTADQSGTTVPFTSVYNAADDAGQVTQTAGDLQYEMLNELFESLESGDYNGNLVVIAHPAFKGALRNLKDEDGNRVVADPLGAGVPTIFGHELRFSTGARTSALPTDKPTGNPLLIVANRDHMILGIRDGIESQVSDLPRWETDEVELKMRARRAFVPATGEAFYVVEKTLAEEED
jgi:HK97 family phage major capsid protein